VYRVWHIADEKWERKPKAGMAPSKRASFAMVSHKTRAVLFGGTADEEGKGGEVLVSNFFNDLYQLNLSQWRWYPVAMRAQKPGAGTFSSMSSTLLLRQFLETSRLNTGQILATKGQS
jgi:Galactose oxidase, central domain